MDRYFAILFCLLHFLFQPDFFDAINRLIALHMWPINDIDSSGGQSTQIKYLSKSTDTYNKILLQ